MLLLEESRDDRLPLCLKINVRIERYGCTGYGSSTFSEEFATYKVVQGQGPNWLMLDFYQDTYSSLFTRLEFRLTAHELVRIVEAFKNDIRAYLSDIHSESAVLEKLFQQVESFLSGIG